MGEAMGFVTSRTSTILGGMFIPRRGDVSHAPYEPAPSRLRYRNGTQGRAGEARPAAVFQCGVMALPRASSDGAATESPVVRHVVVVHVVMLCSRVRRAVHVMR